MSGDKMRTFLFTEKRSGRILAVKRSRELDFTIPGEQWDCHEIASTAEFAVSASADLAWSAVKGLQSVGPVDSEQRPRIQLLQQKLTLLISMRANLHVMALQIKPQLSDERLFATAVSPQNFAKLYKLVSFEKRYLRRKMRKFFGDFRRRIEACADVSALRLEYEDIVNNVTLGGYAAMSKDIEESHVKRT